MYTECVRKVWTCRSHGDSLMSEQEGKFVCNTSLGPLNPQGALLRPSHARKALALMQNGGIPTKQPVSGFYLFAECRAGRDVDQM